MLLDEIMASLGRLAPPGSRVLVATSGGPDSQALLDLVARARDAAGLASVWAMGVDHGLRPEAANELDLAEALAGQHGVPFERVAVEVDAADNVLAAARKARYAALAAAADRLGADRIAVGHTASDQVESVLLHLARGAGVGGAAGMRQRRGRIIRPLLGISRQRLLAYLEAERVAYALDPSNLDPSRARAELRAHVLPALRRLNPRLERAVARFAARARSDDAALSAMAAAELERRLGALDSLDLAGLAALPIAVGSRVLRGWLCLHHLGGSSATILGLLRQIRGGRVRACVSGRTLRSDRGRLWVLREAPYALALPVPGRVTIDELQLTIAGRIEEANATDLGNLQRNWGVAFDADHLHVGVVIRSYVKGDRLQPFGLAGHTKVGDVFTNEKIPRALRSVWPIATCSDEVMWVVGLRRSNLAPVTLQTRRVLTMYVESVLPLQRVLG